MRKWLKRIGWVAAVILVLAALFFAWDNRKQNVVIASYKNDPRLQTVKPGWPGTPVDEDGRFLNDEHPFGLKMTDLLRWQLSRNPFKDAKRNDTERLE
ncbi:MAG TPA: hypothetical protein VK468_08535, partial [Pyrinomonadaceae bacterium]|nr:hypothetical protein [Pyrinomonadaceae bacterium]